MKNTTNNMTSYPQNNLYPPVEQRGSKALKITAIISVSLTLIAVAVFMILFVNRNVNKADKKAKIKVYEIEDIRQEYHYSAMRSSISKINGIPYTCASPKNTTHGEDYLVFYIFQSNEDAEAAFEYMKANNFCQITDEHENYCEGWLDGVCDADIRESITLKGNYIIINELEIIGYDV